eukprot:11163044-Lingulodinium_polyedra.AAC.1
MGEHSERGRVLRPYMDADLRKDRSLPRLRQDDLRERDDLLLLAARGHMRAVLGAQEGRPPAFGVGLPCLQPGFRRPAF